MSAEDGRNLTQLVHMLLAKVDHLQESRNRLQISKGSQSNDNNNRLSHEDPYNATLKYDKNRDNRIYHSSFTDHFKSKTIQIDKLYIASKTNLNLTGEALDEQAEVMYQNTRFLDRGFCVRHFKQKKNTDFLFSQLSRRDSDHYARQLDFVVRQSMEDVDEDDMANALLPQRASSIYKKIYYTVYSDYCPGFTSTVVAAEIISFFCASKHKTSFFKRIEKNDMLSKYDFYVTEGKTLLEVDESTFVKNLIDRLNEISIHETNKTISS
ncbi:hypothetical protein EDC96DRAFT_579299 [Choanephora cucurbitarum]|nr:hypothetical protein EDC96DRAFT_579299 [Choanephora cucurbitarum]